MLKNNLSLNDNQVPFINKYLYNIKKYKNGYGNDPEKFKKKYPPNFKKQNSLNEVYNYTNMNINKESSNNPNDIYMNKVERLRQSQNLTIQYEKKSLYKKNNKRVGLTQKQLINKNIYSVDNSNSNNKLNSPENKNLNSINNNRLPRSNNNSCSNLKNINESNIRNSIKQIIINDDKEDNYYKKLLKKCNIINPIKYMKDDDGKLKNKENKNYLLKNYHIVTLNNYIEINKKKNNDNNTSKNENHNKNSNNSSKSTTRTNSPATSTISNNLSKNNSTLSIITTSPSSTTINNNNLSKFEKLKEMSDYHIERELLYNIKIENAIKKVLELKKLNEERKSEVIPEEKINILPNPEIKKNEISKNSNNKKEDKLIKKGIESGSFPKLTNRKKYTPSTLRFYVDNNEYNNKNYLISNMLISNKKPKNNVIIANELTKNNKKVKKQNKIIYPSCKKKASINTINNDTCKSNSNNALLSYINTKYPYLN